MWHTWEVENVGGVVGAHREEDFESPASLPHAF